MIKITLFSFANWLASTGTIEHGVIHLRQNFRYVFPQFNTKRANLQCTKMKIIIKVNTWYYQMY